VSHFGSYDATYGSLGAVIVLLIWMWIGNLALLAGAALNVELEQERAEGGGG
jgi:membrane protein